MTGRSHLDHASDEIGPEDHGRASRDLDGYDADQDRWAEIGPYSDTPRRAQPITPTTPEPSPL